MSKQIESAEARGPQLPVTEEKVWPVHPGVPAFNTETGYHFRVCVCVGGGQQADVQQKIFSLAEKRC